MIRAHLCIILWKPQRYKLGRVVHVCTSFLFIYLFFYGGSPLAFFVSYLFTEISFVFLSFLCPLLFLFSFIATRFALSHSDTVLSSCQLHSQGRPPSSLFFLSLPLRLFLFFFVSVCVCGSSSLPIHQQTHILSIKGCFLDYMESVRHCVISDITGVHNCTFCPVCNDDDDDDGDTPYVILDPCSVNLVAATDVGPRTPSPRRRQFVCPSSKAYHSLRVI